MIHDQRSMTGTSYLPDVGKVRESWDLVAAQNGFDPALRGKEPGPREHTLRRSQRIIDARVEWGRWLADCPNDACSGAAAAWPENDEACCLDCGTVFHVRFPDASAIAEAELVLQPRPQDAQNWLPTEEDPQDLKAENALRGIPITAAAGPGRVEREEQIRKAGEGQSG